MPKPTLAERFESFVMRELNSGCWLWTGFCNSEGYGHIGVAASLPRKAHRVSYEMHIGPIPVGALVRHKCDTPSCVNPAHLVLGTDADNMADRDTRHRTALGERNGKSKLTTPQARAIKVRLGSGYSDTAIAEIYGVHSATVHAIRHGRTWKHV